LDNFNFHYLFTPFIQGLGRVGSLDKILGVVKSFVEVKTWFGRG